MTTYTTSHIFNHMSPMTLACWIGDIDDCPAEELIGADLQLMQAAMHELFALVGMEAVTMLEPHGIDETHPLLSATIAAYNEE